MEEKDKKAMSENNKISVKILCFNQQKNKKPYFKNYEIKYNTKIDKLSVLNVLDYIYENIDSSIAYYSSCRIGKCEGCVIRINGKVKLACTALVEGDLVLEPVSISKIIRDLMVEQ